MKRRVTLGSLVLFVLAAAGSACGQATSAEPSALSEDQIRALLVEASKAAYNGACPCPESRNSRGARCGGNSAYSRGGGNRPLCYPSNLTPAMIQRYRDSLPKP